MTNSAEAKGLFARDVVKKFYERLAESQDLSEVVRGEVRAGAVRIFALATDLNDADNLAINENRRADHFLDRAGGSVGGFYALEYGGVACSSKIIFDLGPALASRARGEGRIAGQGDKPDIFQGFRDQEMQEAPACRNRKNSDLILFDTQIPGDFLRHGGKVNLLRARFF